MTSDVAPVAMASPSSSRSSMEGSWLVTPPPCFHVGGTGTVDSHPMEDLLIEHASMSVYGSVATPARGRGRQPMTQVEPAARPARACVTRAEPYNLRKTTMQKAQKAKTQTTKKAFTRQNKTLNLRQKSFKPVFQPSKLQ